MPIYEYECGQCQWRFEMKQGFDAEPMAICPQCQGKARRILHPAPLLFKGSGFYITDSRQSSQPGMAKGKQEPAPEKQKGK